MVVGIIKSTYNDLDENLEKLFELINYKPKRDKFFIKPNIVDALPPRSAVIVNYKLIKALIEYLQNKGASEIVIGEGTGFFTKPEHFEKVIKATKFDKIEKEFNIKIVNLEHSERIKVKWKYGKIPLPKIVFDEEYEYINVPKMKTHTMTQVTLSCKNQKGLLNLNYKRMFHKKNLHEMIRELSNIVKPDLVLMDAITALEGSGPTENPQTKVKKVGVLLASVGKNNLIEIDNVAATIMGFDINEIKHIPKIDYKIVGIPINEIQTTFIKPDNKVKYGNIIHHQNEKTCTLCQIALSQTLRKINFNEELRSKLEELQNKYEWIDILQGGGWENLPESCIKPILLGNCTKEFANKMNLNYCKGCPPHYNDIIEFIFSNTEN
ncbi:MAG: DUF362 domain-containing protein [Candidatus Helarchaeota archaeon]